MNIFGCRHPDPLSVEDIVVAVLMVIGAVAGAFLIFSFVS